MISIFFFAIPINKNLTKNVCTSSNKKKKKKFKLLDSNLKKLFQFYQGLYIKYFYPLP